MLQPLKAYNVIVYPDKTVYKDWNQRAMFLNKLGFNVQCINLLENLNYYLYQK